MDVRKGVGRCRDIRQDVRRCMKGRKRLGRRGEMFRLSWIFFFF